MSTRYFLKFEHDLLGTLEKEVTKEEWVRAERSAGFYPRYPDSGEPCTGGFGSSVGDGTISGYLKYEDDSVGGGASKE